MSVLSRPILVAEYMLNNNNIALHIYAIVYMRGQSPPLFLPHQLYFYFIISAVSTSLSLLGLRNVANRFHR